MIRAIRIIAGALMTVGSMLALAGYFVAWLAGTCMEQAPERNRLRASRWSFLLLLIACSDPLDPACVTSRAVSRILRDTVQASVTPESLHDFLFADALADFRAQLATGSGLIELTGPVYCFGATIDLAPPIAPNTHTIRISGSGGFTDRSALYDCNLRLSPLREAWDVGMEDVTIYGGSLDFEGLIVLSTFSRVRVQGATFRLQHSAALTFIASYFLYADVQLEEAGQTTFVTGAIEESTFTLNSTTVGDNAGPVIFFNPHLEHSFIHLNNVPELRFIGGQFTNTWVYRDGVLMRGRCS